MTQSGECRILPAQSGIHLFAPDWHYFPIGTSGGTPRRLVNCCSHSFPATLSLGREERVGCPPTVSFMLSASCI